MSWTRHALRMGKKERLIATVPVLDFEPIARIPFADDEAWRDAAHAEDTRQVVEDFDRAMRRFGFVQITSHGVSRSCLSSLRRHADNFFEQEHEEKMRLNLSEHYGAAGGGFTPIGRESVGRTSDASNAHHEADPVENFVFANRGFEPNVPDMTGDFSLAAQKYWSEAEALCTRLMRTSALALGLQFDFFDDCYRDPSCSLRLANYRAPKPTDAGKIRYGAHTDYQGFTILNQTQEGLEVFVEDDDGEEWVPVPPCQRGGFVVNAGDLIPIWTAGRWKSALHRVMFPKNFDTAIEPSGEENSSTQISRLSCVFFTGPHIDTMVSPVPTCRGQERYVAIRAGDHLQQKLDASNV